MKAVTNGIFAIQGRQSPAWTEETGYRDWASFFIRTSCEFWQLEIKSQPESVSQEVGAKVRQLEGSITVIILIP